MKLADYSPVASPSPEEQRDALQKGLGRAMQWAMAGKLDDAPLLDACLHDTRYDAMFNDCRGHWLWDIIQAVQGEDRFRPAILEAFLNLAENNALQLCELGFHYAAKGDEAFRSHLYQIVREKPATEIRWLGEEEIIRLDGEAAFLLAVRLRGQQLQNREWEWDDSSFADEAVKQLGEERVNRLLDSASEEAIKRFRDGWVHNKSNADQKDKPGQSRSEQMRRIPSNEIIAAAADPTSNYSYFRGWGRWAEESDLDTICQYMLSTKDPEIIVNCLKVFSARSFPDICPELIDLCLHHNDEVRRWAIGALENNSHPLVRQLAEEELRKGVPDGLALGLFIKNFQTGDEQRILEFAELPDDNDQLHRLLMDIRNICKENDQADCSQLGVVAYALNPCGMCRESAAELLHDRKVAPSWLTDECQFDSNAETRKLAERQSHAE